MKKILINLLLFLCPIILFNSCQEEKETPHLPVETINGEFKSSDENNKLELTYSGSEMIGKCVAFNSADNGKTATLTLKGENILGDEYPLSGVIPGEETTTLNVDLVIVDENSYSFEGKDEKSERVIDYKGTVEAGKLKMDLNVAFNNEFVNTAWTLDLVSEEVDPVTYLPVTMPIYFDWKSEAKIAIVPGVLEFDTQTILGLVFTALPIIQDGTFTIQAALNASLKGIEFRADGNIVAEYSESEDLTSPEWEKLEINIAQYYIKDNKMYVVLNVAAIMESLENMTKADPNLEPALPGIMALVPMLSSGLPLAYTQEVDGLKLYLDTDFLVNKILKAIVLPLIQDEKNIEYITEMLESDPDMADLVGLVLPALESMPAVINGTSVFNLGLSFHK